MSDARTLAKALADRMEILLISGAR